MKPQIISYPELMDNTNSHVKTILEAALLRQGIVGIKDVPGFEATAQRYVAAAREFAALPETVKERYKPFLIPVPLKGMNWVRNVLLIKTVNGKSMITKLHTMLMYPINQQINGRWKLICERHTLSWVN